ncbi:MAG: hypothetical protein D6704_13250 [Nitrospirae bacterium]|nr:MAG: hypothetical protein D6704_13250 [Nitrospirota bacterium]
MSADQQKIPHTKESVRADHQPPPEPALGWEGHVHFPSATLWGRILQNWPELRTGLAFSVVFVAGALIGGGLATFFACQRKKSDQ